MVKIGGVAGAFWIGDTLDREWAYELFGDNTRATRAEQSPSTNIHVVTALGNEDGLVRVLSHHREGHPSAVLTLEELLK